MKNVAEDDICKNCHLLNVYKSATFQTEYLQVQLIEHIFVKEGEDADKLYGKEKNILTHGLNNMNEWYVLIKPGLYEIIAKDISYCFIF